MEITFTNVLSFIIWTAIIAIFLSRWKDGAILNGIKANVDQKEVIKSFIVFSLIGFIYIFIFGGYIPSVLMFGIVMTFLYLLIMGIVRTSRKGAKKRNWEWLVWLILYLILILGIVSIFLAVVVGVAFADIVLEAISSVMSSAV